MPDFKNLLRKGSLSLLDGLLLTVASAALTYLSLPFIHKFLLLLVSMLHESGDIRPLGFFVYGGVGLLLVCLTFLGAWAVGFLVFGFVSERLRVVCRVTLCILLVPIFAGILRLGPDQYFHLLVHPEIRASHEKYKAAQRLQQELKASRALTIERETNGIAVTNATDQVIRLQVAFIAKADRASHYCYPSEYQDSNSSALSLAPHEYRLFSAGECQFDDYAVWARDEKGTFIYLSANAFLPAVP